MDSIGSIMHGVPSHSVGVDTGKADATQNSARRFQSDSFTDTKRFIDETSIHRDKLKVRTLECTIFPN